VRIAKARDYARSFAWSGADQALSSVSNVIIARHVNVSCDRKVPRPRGYGEGQSIRSAIDVDASRDQRHYGGS
jgi:hypothetical protein